MALYNPDFIPGGGGFGLEAVQNQMLTRTSWGIVDSPAGDLVHVSPLPAVERWRNAPSPAKSCRSPERRYRKRLLHLTEGNANERGWKANPPGCRSSREVALMKEHVSEGKLGFRSQSFLAHWCARLMALFSPVISCLLPYIPLEHLSSHPISDWNGVPQMPEDTFLHQLPFHRLPNSNEYPGPFTLP